jgi:single-strand DNA-binding protein
MAMSLNRVQLIGNLTRDPEVKQIPGGQMVASFSIATNQVWTDASGQKQQKVEYHNLVAWRKLAEICASYLKKGSKVFVEGRLQTRSWEGEDGVKRYRTEIVVDNMIMLDKKGEVSGEYSAPAMAVERNAGGIKADKKDANETLAAVGVENSEVSLDDLPF